jgi:hypothetical protein
VLLDPSSELSKLQMRMFMDYCDLIEKLWLEWKEYYLHFFTSKQNFVNFDDQI